MAFAEEDGEEMERCYVMDNCAEIRNLSISFSKRAAVSNISLDIPHDGITVLLGRSGSGKTTLLRALNRLNETFEGYEQSGSVKVCLDGLMDDIYTLPSHSLTFIRRKVGMVCQVPNPLPMSMRRNMILPMSLVLKLGKKEAAARMEKALTEVGLWDEVKDRLDSSAMAFSGGQQQRMCLARTLALEPDLLLLDEPTASLDRKSSELIEEHLLSLKGKYPMIMVSHSLSQAARLGDRFIIMSEGSVRVIIEKEYLEQKDAESVLNGFL